MARDINIDNTVVVGSEGTEQAKRNLQDSADAAKEHEEASKDAADAQQEQTEASEEASDQAQDMQGAFKGVRLEFLGVMFGGQQLAKTMGGLTQPMKDAAGISDLFQAQLLSATADGIEPAIQATQRFGDAINKVPKLGTGLLVGEGLGRVLGGLGQAVLFADSMAASFGNIPGVGNVLKGISGGLLGNPNIQGTPSDISNTPMILGGGKSVELGSLLKSGIQIAAGFFLAKNAFEEFTEGNILGGIGSSLSLAGGFRILRGKAGGKAALGIGVALSFVSDVVEDEGKNMGESIISGLEQAGLALSFAAGGTPAFILGVGLSLSSGALEIGKRIGNFLAENVGAEFARKLMNNRAFQLLANIGAWLSGEPVPFPNAFGNQSNTTNVVVPEGTSPRQAAHIVGETAFNENRSSGESFNVDNMTVNVTDAGRTSEEAVQELRRQFGNRSVVIR